ncbi:MAG: tetratricopeptide repeat protein [Verrucomicrobiia bacterium]
MRIQKFVVLAVVIAGFLAYHNSFFGPFVFDDVSSIVDNPRIRHLWPIWDALSPSVSSMVGGRPVVNLSLALNYALGGLAVWGYHALNLAIHILAGLTLFGVVRRTLLRPALRERFGPSAVRLALAVAVLWTVHPLQTEAVTYISQRCESLMGLFYLLTLYCFIRGADSQRSGWWFTLLVVACLLGMATKEVMVTAPLMVLLYDRTFVSGSFREAWARHGRLYLALAGSWLLLGYLMVGLHYRGVGYGQGIPWWAYALTECRSIVRYLWLAMWPHPLVFDYGPDIIWHVADAAAYALILALLLAGVLLALGRWPVIGFVGAWFFIILAPTSSMIPVGGQPMAEHRMYLSLAAVVALGVMGIHALIGRRTVGVVVVLAIALGTLTWRRNQDYRNDIALWDDTVAKCPQNSRAQYNLGGALTQTGKIDEAITHYEQALRIKPDYAEAHNNLGMVLAKTGKIEEAVTHYKQSLQINPKNAEADNNLGSAFFQEGKINDAIGRYEQALQIRPDYAEAHRNLGIVLMQTGKIQDAIAQYEEALGSKPDYADAHYSLGLALARLGRLQEAVQHWEQALRIKPDYAEVHYSMGVILERAGRVTETREHYEQALRSKPDYGEAHENLGNILLQEGKTSDAIGHYEQALRSKPDYADAHYSLGLALARLGRMPEAVEHWEQALRIKPDYAEVHFALGMASEQAGKVREAIGHYEQALRSKPDFTQAQNALARLQGSQ